MKEYWETKGKPENRFITEDFIDSLLFERLKNEGGLESLIYLLECFSEVEGKNEKDEKKKKMFEKCKKSIVTKSVLIFEENLEKERVLSILQNVPENKKPIFVQMFPFFVQICEDMQETSPIFSQLFSSLKLQASNTTIVKSPITPLYTLQTLLTNERIVKFVTKKKLFLFFFFIVFLKIHISW